MSVQATHFDYDRFSPRWQLTKDVVDTEVKSYLRTIDSNDKDRTDQYKNDAILTNFTARTKHVMVGAAFRRPPQQLELPVSVEYLLEDATGNNRTLEQLAQELVGDTLESGRVGLLVDFPDAPFGVTQEEMEQLNLKARVSKYDAFSIRNWQPDRQGGNTITRMVVLSEQVNRLSEDGFTWIQEEQFRVLRLTEEPMTLKDGTTLPANVYVQVVMNEANEIISFSVPRRQDGSFWDEIPFVFIGSENNDMDVDSVPLYDIARLNIGHYKNSADYEESVHIVGQPTYVIDTAYSKEDLVNANPDGLKVGARRAMNLGQGGKMMLVQPSPNQLADVAMQRKEEQARMIGARLIVDTTGKETAEAARMRHAGETTVLGMIVRNVQDGLIQAIEYAIGFMSTNPESEIEQIELMLNMDFFDSTTNPQLLVAQLQMMDRGVISKNDVRMNARRDGLIEHDRTDDEIDAESEIIDPLT